MDSAIELAELILKQAPLAVKASKRAINRGYEMDLAHGLEMEAEMFGVQFSTEDQKNGMTAFVNKEKPNFEGK